MKKKKRGRIIKKGSDKIEVLQLNHHDRVNLLFLIKLIYKIKQYDK